MSELDRLYAGMRKARELGDRDKMQRIGAYIRTLEEQKTAEPIAPPALDEAASMALEDTGPAERAAIGAGRVVASGIEGVQDAYYGLTGQEEKRAALNERADEDELRYKAAADQSGMIKAGNIVGEIGLGVAAGAPLGGAYKAAKTVGGFKGALQASGLIAAEAGTIEGVRNRGDALDRVIDAGEGAAMGLAGQAVLSGAGKLGGATVRRIGARLKRSEFDESITPLDEAAKARIRSARDDGGYVLDEADAYVDRSALAQRDALRRESSAEGVMLQNRHATAEQAVTDKADELIAGATDGSRVSLNERTDAFAESMRTLRADDLRGVDDAYNAWRALPEAESIQLNTDTIREPVAELLNKHRITANGGVHGKMKALLEQYGVLKAVGGELGGELPVERPLTAANYEQLIQDINSLYAPGNNGASKQLTRGVREYLEEAKFGLLESAPGASTDAIRLGQAARSARKAFAAKWEQGDIVDKLTSMKPGTEEYRAAPVDAVRALMSPRNLDKLKKVKSMMEFSKHPEHKQFLADIQAAPLFDAMDAALKGRKTAAGGVPIFSDHAFISSIRKMSDDQLEALYGPSFVTKLGKAEKAWKLREAQPNWQSNANPSGTAEVSRHLAAAGIRIASTRGAGSDSLAVIPLFAGIKDIMANRAKSKDFSLLLSGKLPAISKDIREEAFKKIIKDAFPNPQFTKFDSAFSLMARQLARSYENNNFDE